jgi:hypothetical protein
LSANDSNGLDKLGLRVPVDAPAPPPSAALASAVASMKPVRTRSRFSAGVIVALLGIAWPAVWLTNAPIRKDLAALPLGWVVLGAALWGFSFALSLGAALVPRRGDVLPAVGVAARVGAGAMGVLLAFTALWTASVPGVSLQPADLHTTTLGSSWGCARFVLGTAAPFLVLGFLALRKVLPLGGRAAGLALGVAGGALGGLALHFHCPVASTGHVLIGHVGAMIAASLAGALLLGALLDP